MDLDILLIIPIFHAELSLDIPKYTVQVIT